MIPEPSFTLGIEEEYLVVDRESRDLISEAPADLVAACRSEVGEQVTTEFFQCQIEVGTRVCHSLSEARQELVRLRAAVSNKIAEHGLALLAASTHPFATSGEQHTTEKARYQRIALELQEVGRRFTVCGMHVHVGIEDPNLRIDLMSQATYFLPHLLALSTSSPFWHGHPTGLMSYRIAVWDEVPRTGVPEAFESHGEYERHVATLVNAGLVDDATRLWWDIRPSARFPTLEMRITDLCTRIDDALCLAAVYRCWLRMLYRLRRDNQRWRRYSAMLIRENRWLAQRYGFEKGLVDFGRGEIVPYADLVDDFVALIREDAEFFDCVAEVEHVRTILERGTSAHWQLRTFEEAKAAGATHEEALQEVVAMLLQETLHGVAP